MWIFLPFGLLSAVSHRRKEDVLIVRAWRREQLEEAAVRIGRMGTPLSQVPAVESTPSADYPFRFEVSRHVFGAFVASQVVGIRYDRFKPEAAIACPAPGAKAYRDLLSRTFHAAEDMEAAPGTQERRRRAAMVGSADGDGARNADQVGRGEGRGAGGGARAPRRTAGEGRPPASGSPRGSVKRRG